MLRAKLKKELKNMRLKAKIYNIEFWFCVFCLLVWRGNLVCGASGETLFGETVEDKSTGRSAAVYFYDGKVQTGKI